MARVATIWKPRRKREAEGLAPIATIPRFGW